MLKPSAAVVVVALVASGLPLMSIASYSQPKGQQAETNSKTSPANTQVTQSGPLSVRIENAQKNQQTVDAYAAEQERESSDTDTARLAWVAIFLTAIQAIIFAFTLRATNRLASGAETTAKRQLRAYISAAPEKAFVTAGEFGVIVQIKNSGSTPAFETRIIWQMNIGPKPEKGDFDYIFTNPKDDPIPEFVMYPGSTQSSVRTHTITEAEMASLEANTAVIRVFGLVFYTDAFKDPQTGKFYLYLDKAGYHMWRTNYRNQTPQNTKPVNAPFKFTQGNNRASFS